jgi:hypothetical protein
MSTNQAPRSIVKTAFALLGCGLLITLAAAGSTAVVDVILPRGAASPLRWVVPLVTGCVMALLCALAWRQYAQAQQRQRGLSERLAEVSRALGFAFHEEMPAERLTGLPAVPAFKDRSDAHFRNLMEGEADGVKVLLFDFYPDPLNPQAHETYLLFPERDERLPDFVLEPKGLSDRLLGHKGFVFDPTQAGDAHAAEITERFAARYTLDGSAEDEPALRQAFRGATLEAFTQQADGGAQVTNGVLLLSRRAQRGEAEERPALLREALRLRRLLRAEIGEESAPAPVAPGGTRRSLRRAVLAGLGVLLMAVLLGHIVGASVGYVVGFLAGAAEGNLRAWTREGMRTGSAVGRVAVPVLLILAQGLMWWARRHFAAAELRPPSDGPAPAPALLRHGLRVGIWLLVVAVCAIPAALGIALGGLVAGWCLPLVDALGGDRDQWGTPLTVGLGGVGGLLGLALPVLLWRKARKKGQAPPEAEPPATP